MAVTTLALILGDSHVCWLGRLVSSSGIRFGTGSSFVGTDCHFKFAGFRGGSVSSVRDDGAVDRLLDLQMPAIVVLCLGGNDVYGSPESVLTVGMRLYEYAQSLLARGVLHVVVCQIVRRQCVRRYSWEDGTQRVVDINEFLKAVCDTERLSFWYHRGFWQSQRNIFRGDGVHFNDLGNYKLWRSVKGAVFVALKRLGLGR